MPSSGGQGFLFRVDSLPEIGAGHATRSRALALALRENGARVSFAATEASLPGLAELAGDGFAVAYVPACDPRALAGDDLSATIEAARRAGARCVVVDHYGADGRYLRALRDAGFEV